MNGRKKRQDTHMRATGMRPLLLRRADHRDQSAQECGLLGGGKLGDRLQQEVRPWGGRGRLTTPGRFL